MSFLRNNNISIFREVQLRLKSAFAFPRKVGRWIKRIIEYAPILWDDWDWDYSAFLRLMQYKLKRMRTCIIKNDIICAAPRVGKQIRYAEFLIERILNDDYFPELQAELEEKFGETKWNFIPVDDPPGCSRLEFTYNKCKTAKENKEADKARQNLYEKQRKELEKDYDRLFRHIRKFLQRWWD